MGTNLRDGNIDRMGIIAVNINPTSVAANTSAEQTFTVPGLKVGDFVVIVRPSLFAGFCVIQARVSADNTLAIQFANVTAAPIDVGAQDYPVAWFRPTPGARLPTAVQV